MSKKALVIDDEESLREVLIELLQMWDFDVVEQGGAEQALEFVASHNPKFDIIFIDVNLPNMSGKELYERLRPKFPNARYIFMSGFDQDQNTDQLPEQGDFAYLKKPFRIMDLKALIDRLLSD